MSDRYNEIKDRDKLSSLNMYDMKRKHGNIKASIKQRLRQLDQPFQQAMVPGGNRRAQSSLKRQDMFEQTALTQPVDEGHDVDTKGNEYKKKMSPPRVITLEGLIGSYGYADTSAVQKLASVENSPYTLKKYESNLMQQSPALKK